MPFQKVYDLEDVCSDVDEKQKQYKVYARLLQDGFIVAEVGQTNYYNGYGHGDYKNHESQQPVHA